MTRDEAITEAAYHLHVARVAAINRAPYRMTLAEFIDEAGAPHSGDCTNECHTCDRCWIDEAMKTARDCMDLMDMPASTDGHP